MHRKLPLRFTLLHIFPLALVYVVASVQDGVNAAEGAQVVTFHGYDDCIALRNESTEVVLCPAAGGRVLKYAVGGKNILYLPPGGEGWRWDGKNGNGPMNAGRFDIGPEKTTPRRPTLWQGEWTGEILGDRRALMRSKPDAATGVRLEREFVLAPESSKLQCTQTIVNVSDQAVEYCHWSRTFVVGKGVCVIPLSTPSKYPNSYVRYDTGNSINFRPTDEHIERVGDYFLISDRPESPKLGFDSHVGWLAYVSPTSMLFVKRFPTYPERSYNEVAGLTISVWYPDGDMVELEPIGPRERLGEGERASFTETWYLLEKTDIAASEVNPTQVAEAVQSLK